MPTTKLAVEQISYQLTPFCEIVVLGGVPRVVAVEEKEPRPAFDQYLPYVDFLQMLVTALIIA
jgi:hypothetical protein